MSIPRPLLDQLLELAAEDRADLATTLLGSLRDDDDELEDDDRRKLTASLSADVDDTGVLTADEVLRELRRPSGTPHLVRVTGSAAGQLRAIDDWWRVHHPEAPTVLADDLTVALARIATTPRVGVVYAGHPGVRRLALPRARYHVYYTIDETQAVAVQAFWPTSWRRGPRS